MKKRLSPQQKLARNIRPMVQRLWNQYLSSEGERQLILDPAKFTGVGTSQTVRLGVGFNIGDRKITRTIERTFYPHKPTTVPAILANSFLQHNDIVEVETTAIKEAP